MIQYPMKNLTKGSRLNVDVCYRILICFYIIATLLLREHFYPESVNITTF